MKNFKPTTAVFNHGYTVDYKQYPFAGSVYEEQRVTGWPKGLCDYAHTPQSRQSTVRLRTIFFRDPLVVAFKRNEAAI